jgi:deoxycytidine triphosphate deaminase
MADSNFDLQPGIIVKQDIENLIFKKNQLLSHAIRENLEPCSYDLRIGTIFRQNEIQKPSEQTIINIKPGEILNIFTMEEINLPPNITAVVYPINLQSSRGLLVLNPGHIDPGYKGPITIKAVNLNRVPLPINRGMKIFTIIFYVLPSATTSPYQEEVNRDDKEREYLKELIKQDTSNISQIISMQSGAPFPTQEEVKSMIRTHWLSWIVFGLTLIAAISGVLSVYISLNSSNS